MKKNVQLCVFFMESVIYQDFRVSNIFNPLFNRESQIRKWGQNFWKSEFFGHCSFTQLFFYDFVKLSRKKKYLWRGYKDCDKNNIYAWQKKPTRSSQSCNFGKILHCWKDLGMLQFSRFFYWILVTPTSHIKHACFSEAAIIKSMKLEIVNTTSSKSVTINFITYFCMLN